MHMKPAQHHILTVAAEMVALYRLPVAVPASTDARLGSAVLYSITA